MTADRDALVKRLEAVVEHEYLNRYQASFAMGAAIIARPGALEQLLLDAIAMITAPAEAPVADALGFPANWLVVDEKGRLAKRYSEMGDTCPLASPLLLIIIDILKQKSLPQSAPVSREAVIEECAKVCDGLADDSFGRGVGYMLGCEESAAAIRAIAHPAEPAKENRNGS